MDLQYPMGSVVPSAHGPVLAVLSRSGKTRSQYTAGPSSGADAQRAFGWATRMTQAAADALTS